MKMVVFERSKLPIIISIGSLVKGFILTERADARAPEQLSITRAISNIFCGIPSGDNGLVMST